MRSKGKSGSGKTTLLSLLSGLETDYEGNIYFRERELRQFDRIVTAAAISASSFKAIICFRI